jgi:hypothetical protein
MLMPLSTRGARRPAPLPQAELVAQAADLLAAETADDACAKKAVAELTRD